MAGFHIEKHTGDPTPRTAKIVGKFPVEVKKTKGKGVGVFATRRIMKDEICCWYDGFVVPSCFCDIISGKSGYSLEMGDGEAVAGFPTQLLPGGVAQLCNDSIRDYTDDNDSLKKSNVRLCGYHPDFAEYGTSLLENQIVFFVAHKRIKKGEELTFTYGNVYWAHDANDENKKPAKEKWFGLLKKFAELNGRDDKIVSLQPFDFNDHTLRQYTLRYMVCMAIAGHNFK